jgi:hypothetical protein
MYMRSREKKNVDYGKRTGREGRCKEERGREMFGEGYQRRRERSQGKPDREEEDHWMMHRQPAVGSSPSPRAGLAPPPPLALPFADFAFSSSSMTS